MSCILCGSNAYQELGTIKEYKIVKCAQCTFVYAHPLPKMDELIKYYAQKNGVDVILALSLALVESQIKHTYKSGKVRISPKGAVGLFQVMPWVMSNYNLTNIHENADAAMKLLAKLIKDYNGDKWIAMEAYNCGPTGRLGKYKNAAKRFRRKVSVTYVRIRKSGKLWNIYTKKYSSMR